MSDQGLPLDWNGAPVSPLRWMAVVGWEWLFDDIDDLFDVAFATDDWCAIEALEARQDAILAWAVRRWGKAWDDFWPAECVPPGIDMARRAGR